MQLLFAGAATIATLALFGAGTGDAKTVVASGSARLVNQVTDLPAPAAPFGPQTAAGGSGSAGRIVAVGDDVGGVNDNGQTSGDIFTQNAQDQSTA